MSVSPDDLETTKQFCEQLQLTQLVVCDPDRKIAVDYEVARLGGWFFNRRITYVIDRKGKIRFAHHAELSLDGHYEVLTKALEAR